MTPPPPAVPQVDPARVHALIVGVEAYEAGGAWDLPGPARDAVRFHRMLLAAGVPGTHLRLHLSPLPPYVPDLPYRPADRGTLRRVLVDELPIAQGDLLWVWWGGHGVLDRAERLRLFCADATTADKAGIDLESALARYASDSVPALTEQMWIVDACATFEEALGSREQLPVDTLPVGRRTVVHRQTALLSAGRGRAAANDPVRATGLFSDVLLGLLADHAADLPAPPDPEKLFQAVRERFATLRNDGLTLQFPEIRLTSPERTAISAPQGPPPAGRSVQPLQRAVEALLAYPLMADPTERQTVIAALDPRVAGTLPRHSKARTDAANILTGLARRHREALWDLFDAVVSVDDDRERGEELQQSLRELTTWAQRLDKRK